MGFYFVHFSGGFDSHGEPCIIYRLLQNMWKISGVVEEDPSLNAVCPTGTGAGFFFSKTCQEFGFILILCLIVNLRNLKQIVSFLKQLR